MYQVEKMFVMRNAPAQTFSNLIGPIVLADFDRSRSFAGPTFSPCHSSVVFSFAPAAAVPHHQHSHHHPKEWKERKEWKDRKEREAWKYLQTPQSERCQIEVLDDSPKLKLKKKTKRPAQKPEPQEVLQSQSEVQNETWSTKKTIRSIPLIPPPFIQQQIKVSNNTIPNSADFLDEATLQNLKEEPLKFVLTRQSLPL